MSATPERESLSSVDRVSDDADQLRSLVSAMLSGSYQEDSYLWDVASMCRAKPEFGRRLLALIERYSRLGQMPAAQYTRIRQKIEESMPMPGPAEERERVAAAKASRPERIRRSPRGAARAAPRKGKASAVTAVVPDSFRPRRPSGESTVTAPLPASSLRSTSTQPPQPQPGPQVQPGPQSQPQPQPQRTAAAAAPAAPKPSPDLIIEPGAVLRERYELEGLLGCGGMAAVYKALDRYRASLGLSDCHVALKIVAAHSAAPADDAALGREFHNAQQLSHPNIINVFEIDHEAGATFYTMELLEGEKLDELEARIGGPLPPAQALAIVRDIGTAIEHAHSRGILHADLKPQNIFVTFGGHVRVLDFGGLSMPAQGPWISESVGASADASAPERYRTATPAYASCEQLEGQQVDPRDDIYALACIAYELLTGRHPFEGQSALQAREQHLRPRRPRGLTGGSWRALRRALCWERARRPRAIGPWLEQLDVSNAAARLPPSYELRAMPLRNAWGRWTALAATVLICVSAAIALSVQNPQAFDWNELLASAQASLQQARTAVQSRFSSLPGPTTAQQAAAPVASVGSAPLAPSAAAPLASPASPTLASVPGGPDVRAMAPPAHEVAHAIRHRRGLSGAIIASAPSSGAVAESGPVAPAGALPPASTTTASSANAARATNDTSGLTVAQGAATLSAPGQRLQFSSSTYQVNDTSPAARVVVRRSGDTQGELRFVWWTLDDTAKADVDYAPLGRRTEHILPGQDHVTLYVPIISNPLRHQTATFYVALGRPGTENGSPTARASVTINRGG